MLLCLECASAFVFLFRFLFLFIERRVKRKTQLGDMDTVVSEARLYLRAFFASPTKTNRVMRLARAERPPSGRM